MAIGQITVGYIWLATKARLDQCGQEVILQMDLGLSLEHTHYTENSTTGVQQLLSHLLDVLDKSFVAKSLPAPGQRLHPWPQSL